MTSWRTVPDAEFLDVIHDIGVEAFRLEMQRAYAEPEEDASYAAFLRGQAPNMAAVPELAEWYANITRHALAGRRVHRVRIQDEPPTDYQRFERYMDKWNLAAGEDIRYLTWRQAHDIGLLPAAGPHDWWLLDSDRLLVMRFNDAGRRVENYLTWDIATIEQACAWRDLAVHHSAPADAAGVAA